MFSEMKQEIIDAGIMLDRYELVSLTCGNLSVRMPTGEILVTPSGMMYEKMSIDDMIVMDLDGNIIEGTRKPSSDTPAILHIFRERPDINAVIHTHQPYATAISLIPGLTEFRVCTPHSQTRRAEMCRSPPIPQPVLWIWALIPSNMSATDMLSFCLSTAL